MKGKTECDAAEPEILTLDEASALLRVSAQTVRHLLKRGELKGRKVGREWRILRADLLAYMKVEGI